ncbi:hypothetical protein D1O75_26105, partial [Escherichia coli]|nr:hypothetical protein [Escherichia coli]MIL08965.1 hypothetical protein [Salmonella enterica subsp. enterica serovar Enteritidis]
QKQVRQAVEIGFLGLLRVVHGLLLSRSIVRKGAGGVDEFCADFCGRFVKRLIWRVFFFCVEF